MRLDWWETGIMRRNLGKEQDAGALFPGSMLRMVGSRDQVGLARLKPWKGLHYKSAFGRRTRDDHARIRSTGTSLSRSEERGMLAKEDGRKGTKKSEKVSVGIKAKEMHIAT